MLHQLRLSAVGGAVEAGGQLPVVGAHHAGGFLHGTDGVGVGGVHAAEDLVVGGIHQVIGGGGIHPGQGVGAGADSLGLEGLQGEAVAHLIGDDALEVVLHGQGEDGLQQSALDGQLQVAGVEVAPFAEADARAALIGGSVADEADVIAHLQAHALVEQVDLSAADLHGDPAALWEGHGGSAAGGGGIYAVQDKVGAVGEVEAAQ